MSSGETLSSGSTAPGGPGAGYPHQAQSGSHPGAAAPQGGGPGGSWSGRLSERPPGQSGAYYRDPGAGSGPYARPTPPPAGGWAGPPSEPPPGLRSAPGSPPTPPPGSPPPPPAAPDKPKGPPVAEGSQVGNFRIERKLGEGGMGSVFLARHIALGTPAVVKVMHPALAKDKREAQRFLNEAKLGSSIQHPNVVRIYDFGEAPDGAPYMVMELVEGEDLSELIQREERLEPLRAARILKQVASALEAAHTRSEGSIIHRDLKPANVRISERGGVEHVTVLDFGIARAVETPAEKRLTLPGTLVGTPAYMSPEQAMAQALDGRSDIYALGVCAWEMLTGKLPFESPTAISLIVMHLQEELPPIPDELGLPAPLTALMRACLAKERDDRPATAHDVIDALDDYMAQARAQGGRQRAVLVGAGLAVLLAAGLAAWALLGRGAAGDGVRVGLTALASASADLLDEETIYTTARSLDLSGTVSVTGAATALEVRLVGAGGTVAARAAPDDDGRFTLHLADLRAGERTALDLVLGYRNEAGEERAKAFASRAFVCDQRAPHIGVVPARGAQPGYRLVDGGALVYARRRSLAVPLEVAEAVGLAADGVRVGGVSGGLAARVVSGDAGLELQVEAAEGASAGAPGRLTLTAVDLAGNRTERPLGWIVDAAGPSFDGLTVEGRPLGAEGASSEVDGEAGRTLVVRAVLRDGLPIERIELSVTGPEGHSAVRAPDEQATVEEDPQAVLAAFSMAVKAPGAYALRVVATDAAGNTSETSGIVHARLGLQASTQVTVAQPGADPGPPVALAAARSASGGANGGAIPAYVRGAEASAVVEANQALARVVVRVVRLGADPSGAPGAEPPAREIRLTLSADGRRAEGRLPLEADAAQRLEVEVVAASGARLVRRFFVVQDGTPPAVALEPAVWPELLGRGFPGLDSGSLDVRARVADGSPLAEVVVRYGAEADRGRAEVLRAALLEGRRPPGGAVPSQPATLGEDGLASARIPVADESWLVVCVEARDQAGNRAAAAMPVARVDVRPPGILEPPRARFRLHEAIEVVLQTDEPVASVRVDGSAAAVEARPRGGYLYRGGAMLVDTRQAIVVEATDGAGNIARRTITLELEPVCGNTEKAIDAGLLARYRAGELGRHCPYCREPLRAD